MLSNTIRGDGNLTIFFLHWLSGSGTAWTEVTDRLLDQFRCVAIDLPGFGGSADVPGYSVEAMAGAVAAVIAAHGAGRWMLAGHSMGAKVAAVVARRAEEGEAGLAGLESMVLLAGSPPSPEPMEESRREEMIGWFGGDEPSVRKQAKTFVETNRAVRLARDVEERAVEDVLRMRRAAWVAWLESGSREDWSRRVGVLRTPALIVAGGKDADLGEGAQRALMLPHFADGELRVLAEARHLLPMELPEEVAGWISVWAESVSSGVVVTGPALPAAYRELIASDRVSPATRAVLLARAEPDALGYEPRTLTVEELAALRAVAERVVPQSSGARAAKRWIDLAARVDRQLSETEGNGWRYDVLPADAEAYRAGLGTLNAEAKAAHGEAFAGLPAAEQDELLARAVKGTLGSGVLRRVAAAVGVKDLEAAETPAKGHALDGEQMRRWFEEVRADLVRAYVAHPATLARMGYSGIADGGDSATMAGFVQLGVGEREAWEPLAAAGDAR